MAERVISDLSQAKFELQKQLSEQERIAEQTHLQGIQNENENEAFINALQIDLQTKDIELKELVA